MAIMCGWKILWWSRRRIRRKLTTHQSRRKNKNGRAADHSGVRPPAARPFPFKCHLVLVSILCVLIGILPAFWRFRRSVFRSSFSSGWWRGRGCCLRLLKLMRMIRVLIYAGRRSKPNRRLRLFLRFTLLIRLLRRRNTRGWRYRNPSRLRCVLISLSRRRNKFPRGRLLLRWRPPLLFRWRWCGNPTGLRCVLICLAGRSKFPRGRLLLHWRPALLFGLLLRRNARKRRCVQVPLARRRSKFPRGRLLLHLRPALLFPRLLYGGASGLRLALIASAKWGKFPVRLLWLPL